MGTHGASRGRLLVRGLHTSVHGNAQAIGFSVTIAVTFGVSTILKPSVGEFDLLGFAPFLAGVAYVIAQSFEPTLGRYGTEG